MCRSESLFDASTARRISAARAKPRCGRAKSRRHFMPPGVGSRWTQGAGVVKGLHPFANSPDVIGISSTSTSRKTKQMSRAFGTVIPHVFTTSYLTHAPIERFLRETAGDALDRTVWLSPGAPRSACGSCPPCAIYSLPWQETAQQKLDEQKEKMRESVRAALTAWARQNRPRPAIPRQSAESVPAPVGHWFEIPNLLKNGRAGAPARGAAGTAHPVCAQR